MALSSSSLRKAVVAGASGFVGSALVPALQADGWQVTSLVRSQPKSADEVQWNPAEHVIDIDVIAEADVVINLSGASIAGGWWTGKRKDIILQSRLDATTTLAEAIKRADSKPSVLISTSGIGFYGDRPNEVLDEGSASGYGFLPEVCQQWEQAADPAREAGVRVVHPRFGLVLSGTGGMLPLITIPFRFGLGGKIGGDQHMGWVDLHDLVRMFPFLIEHEEIEGAVNAVAPGSVTNAEFTRAMGKALNRPTVIPVPKAIAGSLGGGLVEELLLADQHVVPGVLDAGGFSFERPTIETSLKHAFSKD